MRHLVGCAVANWFSVAVAEWVHWSSTQSICQALGVFVNVWHSLHVFITSINETVVSRRLLDAFCVICRHAFVYDCVQKAVICRHASFLLIHSFLNPACVARPFTVLGSGNYLIRSYSLIPLTCIVLSFAFWVLMQEIPIVILQAFARRSSEAMNDQLWSDSKFSISGLPSIEFVTLRQDITWHASSSGTRAISVRISTRNVLGIMSPIVSALRIASLALQSGLVSCSCVSREFWRCFGNN